MKLMLVSVFMALPALHVAAQDMPPGLPGLPGVGPEPAKVEEEAIQRPDAMKVLADLGPELRLSAGQEERVTRMVDKKAREFDAIYKEYEKADAEEKKWRYKVNDLRYKMGRVNRSIPEGIRDFLDDEQRQNFDAMMDARLHPRPAAPPAEPAVSENAAPAPKALKKRRVIRRKRPIPGGEAPAQDQRSAVPAMEGRVVVDSSPSPEPAGPRRNMRKRPAPPPAAEPAASEAPAAEDEAGSYP